MKMFATVPGVAALLAITVAPTFSQPNETTQPSFRFRGVEAGTTTQDELLKNTRWGTPESRTIHKNGNRFWEYRPRGYKKIVVMLRGGMVQSIDVTLPEGITPEKAAEAFMLGKPQDEKLPKSANLGSEIPKGLAPTRYSAGRVLLFVEKTNNGSRAAILRVYADRVLDVAPAKIAPMAVAGVKLAGQDDTSRRTVRTFVEMFEKHHISRRKLNDKIAANWLNRFIKRIDRGKYYFLQSDIDGFKRLTQGIDDKARLGDIEFAYTIYKTYARRRVKSMEFANKYLAGKFDFTVDERFILPTKSTAYPENELEAGEIWRKRVKYDILRRKAKGLSDAEALDRVTRHYRQVFAVSAQVNDDELMSWAIEDLAKAFDPHSSYYSARSLRDFQIQSRAQMVGIGASLQIEDGYTVVAHVVPGSPSAKDGRLQKGDRIVGVAQGNGEFVDIVGKRLPDIVDQIRGKRATVVRLKVIPKDQQQSRVYEITRGKISLERIGSRVVTRKIGDKTYRVGVIKVPRYYGDAKNKSAPNTTDDTRTVLKELAQQNVDLLVVDFRSHSGGTLGEAIRFPGLFLPAGPLLKVKNSAGQVRVYNVGAVERAWDKPMIVMVNRFTSSGAEIFVGAIQDYRRGLLVGDSSTNGNACVQNLFDIGRELAAQAGGNPPQLGAARITMQTMYRVTGKTWQRQGVRPDVVVPSVYDTPAYGEISLENSIKPDSSRPVAFQPLHWTDTETIRHLTRRSEMRRESNSQLAAYLKALAANARWNSQTSATLKAGDFLAEYRDYRKSIEILAADATQKDPVLDETLDVAGDYLDRIGWHRDYADAMHLLSTNRFGPAVEKFNSILQTYPDLKIAFAGRARAFAGQGDWARAIADSKRAGDSGIPCRVTKATSFRAGTRTIAAAPAGTRVNVSKVSAGWLWSQLRSTSKTAGWIEKQYLSPVVD